MGTVFTAIQKGLGRRVAIKIPHQHVDEDFRQRFLREGATLAGLSHPNVVKVFDADIENGIAYMVMELIEGQTLEDLIRNAPPSVDQVVEWGARLADALDYIHDQHVIHRDIKSANIIINRRGEPVLVDFGVARNENMTRITQGEGYFIGTFQYASPESLNGEPLGAHSDIYSLGIVFYQCLTRQLPFDGGNFQQIAYQVFNAAHIPPHELNTDVPRWLSRVIDTCLHKDPSRRYPSGSALREVLMQRLPEIQTKDSKGPAGIAGRKRPEPIARTMAYRGERNRKGRAEEKDGDRQRRGAGGLVKKSLLSFGVFSVVVLLVLWMVDPFGSPPEPESAIDASGEGAPPGAREALIEPPTPIQMLLAQQDIAELDRLLREYRNEAILSFGSESSQFEHPAECFVVVYNEQGVVTILSPEDEHNTRTDLNTSAPVDGSIERHFDRDALIWVYLY